VSFDALLPGEMARRAEEVGVRKASMDAPRTLALAVLAGAFIGMGGVFATVALTGTTAPPAGPARVLAGVAFSLGLVLVVVGGAELFTGNNLLVMAWAGGRIGAGRLVRSWVLVYVGNFVGAVATAGLVYLAGTYTQAGGSFGAVTISLAASKLRYGLVQAVALGVLCNVLVCLAVWLTYSARTTADRVLAVVPPISAFVAAGFEHSVANMYFVSLALLIASLDPAFVAAQGLVAPASALHWWTFFTRNLIPVTLGNLIGGVGLVGTVYWFIYLRPARAGSSR
jgi:formate/nitrite transporter